MSVCAMNESAPAVSQTCHTKSKRSSDVSAESDSVKKAKEDGTLNGCHSCHSAPISSASSSENPLTSLDEWDDVRREEAQKEAAAAESKSKAQMESTANNSGELSIHQTYESSSKSKESFRNYTNSSRQERVSALYGLQHINQSFEYVSSKYEKYFSPEHFSSSTVRFGIWECLEFLNNFIDDSDPDTENSQIAHALQTAEAIRKKFPGEQYDWFQITGLIHDLGKILSFHYGEPQWAVVGDTYPVGCKFSEKCVFAESFKQNPDYLNEKYNTKFGIYKENCGLENVNMCFGHDEYLYRVVTSNKCTLPEEALYMLRYHSFYPWHKEGQYQYLTNDKDKQMLRWVKEFNQFDLYSKSDEIYDPVKLKPYYQKIIAKYFPEKLSW